MHDHDGLRKAERDSLFARTSHDERVDVSRVMTRVFHCIVVYRETMRRFKGDE